MAAAPSPQLLGLPHCGGSAAAEGAEVLRGLLAAPPAEVASWALDQLESMAEGGMAQSPDLLAVAGALGQAPAEQKRELVRVALSGFAALPVPGRARALRLGTQALREVPAAAALPGGPSVAEAVSLAAEVYGDGSQLGHNAAALLQGLPLEAGSASSAAASSRGAPPPCAAAHRAPGTAAVPAPAPLAEGLLWMAREAGLDQMPDGEFAGIVEETERGAAQLMQEPQQLLDAVAELAPPDREALAEALAESSLVPAEHQAAVKEAVRPGGRADQLRAALRLFEGARGLSWLLVAVPCAELALAAAALPLACETGLAQWMRGDALLAMAATLALYCGGRPLAPAWRGLRGDPVAAMQRWQAARAAASLQERVAALVPGVGVEAYRRGALGLACCGACALCGACWTVVGVVELLGAAFFDCSRATVGIAALFVLMRLCIFAGAASLAVRHAPTSYSMIKNGLVD